MIVSEPLSRFDLPVLVKYALYYLGKLTSDFWFHFVLLDIF